MLDMEEFIVEARLLVDSITMAELDARAQSHFAMPALVLMERAALAMLNLINSLGESGPWLILAGGGNNGGDALAVARLLFQAGQDVQVFTCISDINRRSDGNARQAAMLSALGVAIRQLAPQAEGKLDPFFLEVLESAKWVVDGLCGIGQSGALRGETARLVAALTPRVGTRLRVLALDVPSGLHDAWTVGDACLPATITACLGYAKRCLYAGAARGLAGDIHVLDIGFPRALAAPGLAGPWIIQTSDLGAVLPSLGPDIHKYDRGRVAVVAGSLEYPGAALLCARAAAHSRAGLVNLVVDPPVRDLMVNVVESLVIGTILAKPADALVIGPGWGRHPDRRAQLLELIGLAAEWQIGVVLDADALFALGSPEFPPLNPPSSGHRGWVLTPHGAELARLLNCSQTELAAKPWEYVRAAARQWSATVVLKGSVTWIAQPDGRCQVLDSANPVLATAGTGDVFAGICGAILAVLHRQGVATKLACEQAAIAAVLVLEAAGLQCAAANAWVDATELIAELPKVFGEFSPPALRKTTLNNLGTGRRS